MKAQFLAVIFTLLIIATGFIIVAVNKGLPISFTGSEIIILTLLTYLVYQWNLKAIRKIFKTK